MFAAGISLDSDESYISSADCASKASAIILSTYFLFKLSNAVLLEALQIYSKTILPPALPKVIYLKKQNFFQIPCFCILNYILREKNCKKSTTIQEY